MVGLSLPPLLLNILGIVANMEECRWHVFTAIGGYIAVAIIDLITSGEVARDSVEGLAWPLPVVGRVLGDGVVDGEEGKRK